MTVSDLPKFKYHPNPVETGSFVQSDTNCVSCSKASGWIYVGPVYGEADLDDVLCPWCIADGTAHTKLGAEFVDPDAVGGYGFWESVPANVIDEVSFRTPSFSGWQQERWFTHCKDAAAFSGPAGKRELEQLGRGAMAAIELESGFAGQVWLDYWNTLDRDHGPTAYLFRCRHCEIWGGYSDVR